MPRNSSSHIHPKQLPHNAKGTFKSYIKMDNPINGNNSLVNTEVWPKDSSKTKNVSYPLSNPLSNPTPNAMSERKSSLTRNRKESLRSGSTTSFGSTLSMAALSDTIEGVNYFHNSNRTMGICGKLMLTPVKLSFMDYNDSSNTISYNHVPSFVPFLEHSSSSPSSSLSNLASPLSGSTLSLNISLSSPSNMDIYLLNIGDIKESSLNDGNFILLSIYCCDFRMIEFQLKTSPYARKMIEKLKLLTENGVINGKQSKLTSSLKDNYGFVFKADWDLHDGHWYQCYKLRLTQCNETFQLCDSLPIAFVVPKTLNDQTINYISTKTNRQRVPVVTYLHAHSGHMLFRCSTFEYYSDLSSMLRDSISPLRQIDVESLLPPLIEVESAYMRIRDACYNNSDGNNYLTKVGKWIWCVNRTLKTIANVSHILTDEASVGLIEDDDRHWNSVISPLTQLMIDPKRRTLNGFESLISKEFVFLSGYANRFHSPRNFNHILFTLFLDCVWQLMVQNPKAFQFTSFYLIWLFDCQYTQLEISCIRSALLNRRMSLNPQIAPPIQHHLSLKQRLLLYNPFYSDTSKPMILNHHVSQTQFWSSLYLRWYPKADYDCQIPHEMLLLNELQKRNNI